MKYSFNSSNKLISIKKKGFFRRSILINDYLFSDIHSLNFKKIDKYGNLYFCTEKECHPKLNERNDFKYSENDLNHNSVSVKGIFEVEKIQNYLEKLIVAFWNDTPLREDHHVDEIIIQNEKDEEKVEVEIKQYTNELIGE